MVAESGVWATLGQAQPLAWSLTGAQDRRVEGAGSELTCDILGMMVVRGQEGMFHSFLHIHCLFPTSLPLP